MNTETVFPETSDSIDTGRSANGQSGSHSLANKKILASGGPLFENLLWRLQARHAVESTLILGLCGTVRQAGVSTIASQLAVTAACQQPDRVLLIDANTVAPHLHKAFGVESQHGYSELISGSHSLKECLPIEVSENLDLLPIGSAASHTSSIRVHQRMVEAVLEELSRDYGLIVIDLPPADQLGSTTTLARALSGLLLVVRTAKDKRQEVERAVVRLEQDQIPLWGSVLNR